MDAELRERLVGLGADARKPIDLDGLVKEGLLFRRGRSYYAERLDALPRHVRLKINTVSKTSYGMKLTFCR